MGINNRDGQRFICKREKEARSPLDVPSLNLKISRGEILDSIRSSRREPPGGANETGSIQKRRATFWDHHFALAGLGIALRASLPRLHLVPEALPHFSVQLF